MPYHWTDQTADGVATLQLWPYRSLPVKGFVVFIGATVLMLLVPLMALLGTSLLWGVLPFMMLTVGGVWFAISRSYRDGTLTEILTLTHDRIEIRRRAPNGEELRWDANPYWVSVNLYKTNGPVPHYLTLKGEGREVELGAFLTEDERRHLADELRTRLARLR